MEKTIKEIYDVKELPNEEDSLVKWHNEIIKKTINELTDEDVAKMLRQDVLPEVAVPQAFFILKNNPFAGELYIGELLASLLELDMSLLESHREDVNEIIKETEKSKNIVAWGYPEEKEEFGELIEKLKALV